MSALTEAGLIEEQDNTVRPEPESPSGIPPSNTWAKWLEQDHNDYFDRRAKAMMEDEGGEGIVVLKALAGFIKRRLRK